VNTGFHLKAANGEIIASSEGYKSKAAAVNQQPAAAKVLASLLDKLCSVSARGQRGRLAVVRAMATADNDHTTATPPVVQRP
jgi:hypothetical protein